MKSMQIFTSVRVEKNSRNKFLFCCYITYGNREFNAWVGKDFLSFILETPIIDSHNFHTVSVQDVKYWYVLFLLWKIYLKCLEIRVKFRMISRRLFCAMNKKIVFSEWIAFSTCLLQEVFYVTIEIWNNEDNSLFRKKRTVH